MGETKANVIADTSTNAHAAAPALAPFPLARCPRCGYDLHGMPSFTTCPECGRVDDGQHIVLFGYDHRKFRREMFYYASVVALAILFAIYMRSMFVAIICVGAAGEWVVAWSRYDAARYRETVQVWIGADGVGQRGPTRDDSVVEQLGRWVFPGIWVLAYAFLSGSRWNLLSLAVAACVFLAFHVAVQGLIRSRIRRGTSISEDEPEIFPWREVKQFSLHWVDELTAVVSVRTHSGFIRGKNASTFKVRATPDELSMIDQWIVKWRGDTTTH